MWPIRHAESPVGLAADPPRGLLPLFRGMRPCAGARPSRVCDPGVGLRASPGDGPGNRERADSLGLAEADREPARESCAARLGDADGATGWRSLDPPVLE